MIALHCWHVACQPAAARFRAALRDPWPVVQGRLAEYGLDHAALRRLPLTTWDDYAAWTEQVRVQGDDGRGVLRLVPTSGSGAARKLVPWTAALGTEFRAGVSAWIGDLYSRHARLRDGPAWWVVTPPVSRSLASAVPVGFDDDSAYLGGRLARLVAPTLVIDARRLRGAGGDWQEATAMALLRCAELRLISAWHPSLVLGMLAYLRVARERLLARLPVGARRRDLERHDWSSPGELWPHLELVSCWGDGPAAPAWAELRTRLRGIATQAKGLLATEGVVTIPWRGAHPVAVTAHVHEFRDAAGALGFAHEVQLGQRYEVVLTTGGGLRRYLLGDMVEVTGFVGRVPSLRFLGRRGGVSDLAGEKLDEVLVAQALAEAGLCAALAVVQARPDGAGYRLLVDVGIADPQAAARAVETALRRIHHYDVARTLGQLEPLLAAGLPYDGGTCLARWAVHHGQRLGETKLPALLPAGATPWT